MLAQSFMTAEQLGISDKELSALIVVLGMLDRNEIPHVPGISVCGERYATPSVFNMALVIADTECGTAACLMGWARHVAHDPELFHRLLPPEIRDLFCMGLPADPLHRGKFSDDILPSEAAIALRNYLTTGQPRWREAFELA